MDLSKPRRVGDVDALEALAHPPRVSLPAGLVTLTVAKRPAAPLEWAARSS